MPVGQKWPGPDGPTYLARKPYAPSIKIRYPTPRLTVGCRRIEISVKFFGLPI